mmetsp:Transcript_19188/g.31063  ORF Transcript_19188/g.31063 Transcript_19188/m.31063 type:complete len:230 (+) Transcript_19188:794-1483(+)
MQVLEILVHIVHHRQRFGRLGDRVDVLRQPAGPQDVDNHHAEGCGENDGKHGGGEDFVPPLLPLVKVRLVGLALHDCLEGVTRQRRLHGRLGHPRQCDEQLLLKVQCTEGARGEGRREPDAQTDQDEHDGAWDGGGRKIGELYGRADDPEQQWLKDRRPCHRQVPLHLVREVFVFAERESPGPSPWRPSRGPQLVSHDAHAQPTHGAAAGEIHVLPGEHHQHAKKEHHR